MSTRLVTAAVIGLMAGCSTFEHAEQVENRADARLAEAAKANAQVAEAKPARPRDTVRYIDKPWASLKPIVAAPQKDEPAVKCRLKVATGGPVSLLELGQIITKLCGVLVRITPDALSAIDNPDGDQSASSPAATGLPPLTSSPVPRNARMGGAPPEANLIDVNYNGELSGLLDMIVARFGLSWRMDDGRIKVFSVDTATFHLHAIATSTDMASSVMSGTTLINGVASSSSTGGGGTGGVSGSAGSTQNTSVTLKTSIWTDVKASLDTMKSARGRVSVAPATGTIAVTDTSEVLERVATYIKRENEWLTKQVLFRIKVLSVTSTTNDAMGLNWEAVWKSVSKRYGFGLSSAIGAVQAGANTSVSIVAGSSSPWAGTDAIISALNEQARVVTVREPTASTLNLQPVSVQVASQKGFLAGTSTVSTANVGTTTTTTTGVVTTGFAMSMMPYVLEDDRLLLLFSVNLSSLQNLRTIGVGTAAVEVPEINLPINSTQQVRLKAGDTLVMSGFDQEDGLSSASGNGNANNWVLGGGKRVNSGRSTLVVLITPVLVE